MDFLNTEFEANLLETHAAAHTRRVLLVFCAYRMLIALTILFTYLFYSTSFGLGEGNHVFFLTTVWCLTMINLITLIFASSHKLQIIPITTCLVIVDIMAYSIFIYTSPQNFILFGFLINTSIAGGSILTGGRIALFLAACATLVVLFGHLIANAYGNMLYHYQQVGMVGVTFFATALLAFYFSSRLRKSEGLAVIHAAQLQQLERLNQYIVQRMLAGIMVIDEDMRIALINPAAQHYFNVSKTSDICLRDVSAPLHQFVRKWQQRQVRLPGKVASQLPGFELSVHIMGLFDQAQVRHGAVIYLEDLSRTAQQAYEMKMVSLGRLTASIAHEIRNPLGAISYAAALLAEDKTVIDDKNQRLIDIINQQSERLNNVVKNILQLAPNQQNHAEHFNLAQWLESFVQELRDNALDQVDIDIDYLCPVQEVYFDASQLHQIMTNLCENGLRYSQANNCGRKLHIIVDKKKVTDYIFIEVIDFGIGVTTDVQAHLFEPFFTTEKSGTGLGLYVARGLCEANQASLSYRQAEHGGSCFRITLATSLEYSRE